MLSRRLVSSGINYESSFEAEILANSEHCQIWGYDFTVEAFGPQIPRTYLSRTHFFPYGLGGADAHGPEDNPKMYTLDSLMRMNGECELLPLQSVFPESPVNRPHTH